MLPAEVSEYIAQNPDVSDDEIKQFFIDTYGYSLEEYWEQNPSPLDDPFRPADEYLDFLIKELETESNKNVMDPGFFVDNPAFQKLSDQDQGYVLDRALDIRAEQQNKTQSDKTADRFLSEVLRLKSTNSEKLSFQVALFYITEGIVHILKGTDHVLFVLALLLIPFSFRKILILITLFTISHSITLILSGLGIITLSAKIVEPLIALSIAYTALIYLFSEYKPKLLPLSVSRSFASHAGIIFLFGLFHGLGFAGAFSSLNIEANQFLFPLFLLNIGVEIGQLIVIILAFPLFAWLQKDQNKKIWIHLFAIFITIMALYWTIFRLFS